MMVRRFFIIILLLVWPTVGLAVEQINDFTVEIDVQRSGDITVKETIAVTSEGKQIRRGIYRDLPRYYEKDGAQLPYRYDVTRVMRDGRKEPYDISRDGNAFRIRIGDADIFLSDGAHVYEIEYAVKNQIRYFDAYDELYWNVTGNYWSLPISAAKAIIYFPDGAHVTQTAGYTGRMGSAERNYDYRQEGGAHVFTTTRPLPFQAGLTVAVGFEKGAVDPPSAADKRAEWWARHASALLLAGGFSLLSIFYMVSFNRVGRDPLKGPVFARYEPPEGMSPAAIHHVFYRRIVGHRALIASLLLLAIKGRMRIDAKDKKKTDLVRLDASGLNMANEEDALLRDIFSGRENMTLGGKYDSTFTAAYTGFQNELKKKFGAPYFKWNRGFLIAGIVLTILIVVIASNLSVAWSVWHTSTVIVLVGLSVVFSYLLPAPTEKGQTIRTEIEGFRLYLETAEKLQLNAAKPGTDAPPPMTTERYERFLPFAIALGVEDPWTRHFEKLIPEEAKTYQPRWANMHGRGYSSLHGLNRSLVSSMSSGVSSALPQSSSSSGSSGGGFSGGGGGGGGGGGW
ncbi:DUF2207 domain-containing protein [Hyphococcus sp.]|uniref:DUF2207 domain-containing protein n=1 Tax=Hyphococcus sp. TaxID=2038636 RepID=UPI00207F28D2|nr:MAG: hypothetical protein DHS20C04_27700 [Marinicaulis sp.]